jgi:hypothetical protein
MVESPSNLYYQDVEIFIVEILDMESLFCGQKKVVLDVTEAM